MKDLQRKGPEVHGGKTVGELFNEEKPHLLPLQSERFAACRRRSTFIRGYKVKFFPASRLVNTYIEARQERTILKLEKTIRRRDLIVLDELGYIPLERVGAEHLFGFFSQCYEQTSLVVTMNLPFADRPWVFADDERPAGDWLENSGVGAPGFSASSDFLSRCCK